MPSLPKSTVSETKINPGPCWLGSAPNSKIYVKTVSPIKTPIKTFIKTILRLEVKMFVFGGRLAA